jgi:hypothetical protein
MEANTRDYQAENMIAERNCMIMHGPATLRYWLRTRNESSESSMRNLNARIDAIDKEQKEDDEREEKKEKEKEEESRQEKRPRHE